MLGVNLFDSCANLNGKPSLVVLTPPKQGVPDLYLDVYDGNDAAIRAYKKIGFSKSLIEMKINLGR